MKYLHCYYDLSVSPCSYDFFSFFMHCEIARIRRKLEYIFLHFIKGPKNEFRDDNIRTDTQNLTFFQNVIIPGLSILKSCKKFEWVERHELSHIPDNPTHIFPRGYSPSNPVADYVGNDFVLSRTRGDIPGYFQAPPFARRFASQWISRFNGKKIITLTTREIERDNVAGTRTIETDVWEEFFEYIKSINFQPVVLRDTNKAFNGKRLFNNAIECPEGSLSVPFRLAIYEASEFNFFKNSGPTILANFCDTASATIQQFDNNVIALSENWYKSVLGMKNNCQYPMTRKKMRYVWKKENLYLLQEIFHQRDTQNSEQLNNFHDLEHLLLTLEVATKKFLHDLTRSPLLDEDYLFLIKLDEAKKSFPNIELPDILEIIRKNSEQMFENDIYDKLSQHITLSK